MPLMLIVGIKSREKLIDVFRTLVYRKYFLKKKLRKIKKKYFFKFFYIP